MEPAQGWKDPNIESFAETLGSQRPHALLTQLLKHIDFSDDGKAASPAPGADGAASGDKAAQHAVEQERVVALAYDYEPPRNDVAARYASAIEPRRVHPMTGVKVKVPVRSSATGRHCRRGWDWINPFCEADRSEFDKFGVGVALYFRFLKWVGWTLVAMSVAAFPSLILNVTASYPAYADRRIFASPMSDLGLWRTTLGGLGQSTNSSQVDLVLSDGTNVTRQRLSLAYGLLDFIACLVFMLSTLWLQSSEETMRRRIDRTSLSVDRFSVELQQVPADVGEEEIKQWMERVTGESVLDVVVMENIHTALHMLQERQRIRKELAAVRTERRTVLALGHRLKVQGVKSTKLVSAFTDADGVEHASTAKAAMARFPKPELPLLSAQRCSGAAAGGHDPAAGLGLAAMSSISAILEEDSEEGGSSDDESTSATDDATATSGQASTSAGGGSDEDTSGGSPRRRSATAAAASGARQGLDTMPLAGAPPAPQVKANPLRRARPSMLPTARPVVAAKGSKPAPPPRPGAHGSAPRSPQSMGMSKPAPPPSARGKGGGVGGAVARAVRRVRKSLAPGGLLGFGKRPDPPPAAASADTQEPPAHAAVAVPSMAAAGAMRAGGSLPPADPYTLELDMRQVNTLLQAATSREQELEREMDELRRRRIRILTGVEDEDAPTRDVLADSLQKLCPASQKAQEDVPGGAGSTGVSTVSPLAVSPLGGAAPLGNPSSAPSATSQRAVSAMVSFKHTSAVRTAINLFPSNPLLAMCCSGQGHNFLRLRGVIRGAAVQAPRPSSIVWQNYGFSDWQVYSRKWLTALPSLAILVVSCLLWYAARQAQISSTLNRVGARIMPDATCGPVATVTLSNSSSAVRMGCDCGRLGVDEAWVEPVCEAWRQERAGGIVVTILVALLVLGMNEAITFITRRLLPFEKHRTRVAEDISYYYRLTARVVLNVLLMNIIVNANWWRVLDLWGVDTERVRAGAGNVLVTTEDIASDATIDGSLLVLGSNAPWDYPPEWYANVGSTTIFLLTLYVATSQTLPGVQVLWKKWQTAFSPAVTQAGLNAQVTGTPFPLAEKHARVVSILVFGTAFSAGIPLLLPLAAVTILITYWVDKYALLRLHTLPPLYDAHVNYAASGGLWWVLVLHIVMTLYMYSSGDILTSSQQAGGRVGQNIIQSAQSFSSTIGRFFAVHTSGHILLFFLLLAGWTLSLFSVAIPDVVHWATCGRYCIPQYSRLTGSEVGVDSKRSRSGRRATFEAVSLEEARSRGKLQGCPSYRLTDNPALRQVMGIHKTEYAALKAKLQQDSLHGRQATRAARLGSTTSVVRGRRSQLEPLAGGSPSRAVPKAKPRK